MTEQNHFKRPYKDFQISFELNKANVLEIQALNEKTQDHYSFALDKNYLLEHSQFINLIGEPEKILQQVRQSFEKVTFDEGKLFIPLCGSYKSQGISILLSKDPALKVIRDDINLSKVSISNLQQENSTQNIRIDQLFATVTILRQQIAKLTAKDQQIDQKLQNLKKNDELINGSLTTENQRVTSIGQKVETLLKKVAQFEIHDSNLVKKDEELSEQITKLDQRQRKLFKQIAAGKEAIRNDLCIVSTKYQRLCDIFSQLKIKDENIQTQIEQLKRQKETTLQKQIQRQINSFIKQLSDQKTHFTFQISSSKQTLEKQIAAIQDKLNEQIKSLNQQAKSTDGKITTEITRVDKTIADLNGLITKNNTQFNHQIDSFSKKIEKDTKNKFTENNKAVKENIDKIQQKLHLATKSIHQTNIDWNKKIEQVRSALNKRATQHDNAVNKLKNRMDKVEGDIKEIQQDVVEKIGKTKEQISTKLYEKTDPLEDQLENITKQHAKLLQDFSTLSSETSLFDSQLSKKDEKIDLQIKALRLYHSQLTSLITKLTVDVKLSDQLQKIKNQQKIDLQQINNSLLNINSVITSNKEDFNSKIDNLVKKDSSIQQKITKAEAQITEHKRINEEKTKQIKKAIDNKISELKTNFQKNIRQQNEKINSNYNQLYSILQTKFSSDDANLEFDDIKYTGETNLKKQVQALNSKLQEQIGNVKDQLNGAKAEFFERTVSQQVYQKKIKQLEGTDKSSESSILSFRTQFEQKIDLRVGKTIAQIEKSFDYKKIKKILTSGKLGNHDLNQNSEVIKTTIGDNILHVDKQSSKDKAYNFVNQYEIEPLSIIKYILKVVEHQNKGINVFLSFSTRDCLSKYYDEYIDTSPRIPFENMINAYGRHGKSFYLKKGDQIHCLADLFTGMFQFRYRDQKQVSVHHVVPLKQIHKGSQLFFEVISQDAFKFDLAC